jgi:hypothetical protein
MRSPKEILISLTKEHAPKFIFGATVYLFWVFLEPWSVGFLLAILAAVGLSLLLQYNWRWLSGIGFFLLLVAISFFSLTASYFVASDQFRFRLRSVDDVSFFEFQADNPFGRMLVAKFPTKTIVIKECDGRKVARLPRLSYAAISPSGPSFADKIFFRRFPELKMDAVQAEVRATGKYVKDIWGEDKKLVSLEFGFHQSDFRSVKVTDIFPRSISCTEDSIPLLPLVETLPWDTDNVGDMIKSANRVARLFSQGITRKISPDDLVELRKEAPPNKYGALLNFLSHSLAYEMLNGNVFTEARAQLQSGQCNMINRDAGAFEGPFSALKERLYLNIATDLGKHAYSALPSCHIPEELIEKSEKSRESQKLDQQALLDCLSDRANPLSYCESVSNPTGTGVGLSPTSTSRQIKDFDLLDKEFEDVVIDEKGERRFIDKIEPQSCPALRDIWEGRQFVWGWQNKSSNILEKRFDCSSPDWNKDFERAHSDYNAAQKCAASRHLFPKLEETVQADGLDIFGHFWRLRCGSDPRSPMLSLMEQLFGFADSYDKANTLDLMIVKLGSFEKMAGSERVSDIVSALLQLKSIVTLFCGTGPLRNCIERYYTQPDSRQQIEEKSKAMYSQLGVDVDFLSRDDFKLLDLYARLKSLHNYLINIGICNSGSSPIVVKELKMSDEGICGDLGLGQYYALRKTFLASDQFEMMMLMTPESSFEADLSLH